MELERRRTSDDPGYPARRPLRRGGARPRHEAGVRGPAGARRARDPRDRVRRIGRLARAAGAGLLLLGVGCAGPARPTLTPEGSDRAGRPAPAAGAGPAGPEEPAGPGAAPEGDEAGAWELPALELPSASAEAEGAGVLRPRATVGPAVVAAPARLPGALAREPILEVIRASHPDLIRCREAAARPPGFPRVEIVIGEDGRVTRASVGETEGADADFDRCLERVFSGLVFPPAGPGRSVTIVYPVSYQERGP